MKAFFPRASARVLPMGAAALGLMALFAPNAHAQTAATVQPVRKYANGADEVLVHITTTYDGGTASGDLDDYGAAEATTLLSGGGGLLPASPTSFDTYCVQIGTPINHVSESVLVSSMGSSFKLGKAAINNADYGGALAWIYSNYAPGITGNSQASVDMSTALQLSLWEVEYNWNGTGLSGISTTLDSTLNGSTQNFYYSGNPSNIDIATIRADANTILTAWNGQTLDGGASFLNGSPNSNQSLIGPITGGAAAPEPASLALAAPMFLGILGLRRRRK